MDAKTEILKLRDEIKRHNYLYYVLDSPEISDYEYDMLMQRLRKLEAENPDMFDKTSPTLVVGGVALNKFLRVKHVLQMNSLLDVFEMQSVFDFCQKIQAEFGKNTAFVVEPKIDGLSVALEYENGELTRAATRGDGFVGEDVTENIKTIKSVPRQIKTQVEKLVVRGEVYMPRAVFERLIGKQAEAGAQAFKNARNAAAGSLRQKDPKIAKARELEMFVFNLQYAKGISFKGHYESLNWLAEQGFKTVSESKPLTDVEKIEEEIAQIKKDAPNCGFYIDGAVVKVDNLGLREELGSTSKYPKWAVAFKYPPEEVKTRVKAIEANVGRTGVITPVAVFDPVLISGSMVSRAVLHNQGFVKSKGIDVGSEILVRKAGDIIPEVVEVVGGGQGYFKLPDYCPSCGSKLFEEGSEKWCPNSDCPAQLFRSIEHFVSRNAMNIEGLGPAIVERLIAEKLITSVADIYYLKEEKLLNLERMGSKLVGNLLSSIESSKKAGLARLLCALGIKRVGAKASQDLARRFGDIEKLFGVGAEEIVEIDGFGQVMADSVVSFFALKQTRECVDKLKQAGVVVTTEGTAGGGKLAGLSFVVTGHFEQISRKELEQKLTELGAQVQGSVSKKTNWLLVGESPGSKLKKAQSLGVAVVLEAELESLFAKLGVSI